MVTKEELDRYEAKNTKAAKVLHMLRTKDFVTNIEIMSNPATITTCPHGFIRDLRAWFGYDFIGDEIITKKTKEMYNGKMRTVTTQYKKYFLKKMEI